MQKEREDMAQFEEMEHEVGLGDIYDANGNLIHDDAYEEEMFEQIDRRRAAQFEKEQVKLKERFLFTMNGVLTDRGVSMHQIVYDEVGAAGMVKLSVRDLLNRASIYQEKRDQVSRIIMNAIYCDKDVLLELRAYCRRPDIGRWLTNEDV